MKITERLSTFLVNAKVCDPDKTLSLTNLMMAVLIAKVAMSPELDAGTVASLFLALASYNGKKWLQRDKVKKSIEDTEKLNKLETEVRSLIQAQNLKGLGR